MGDGATSGSAGQNLKKRGVKVLPCGAKRIWGEGGAGHWHGEADAISEVTVPRGNSGRADVTVTEPFK